MLWRETVKEPTQLEVARQELFAATRHRDRMLTNFNNALPEFFEIANQAKLLNGEYDGYRVEVE